MPHKEDREPELAETVEASTNSDKAEWVALMCLIAKSDRDLYRELRADAWESVARSHECSKDSN